MDSPAESSLPMVIRDPWIRALVIVMLLIASVYLTGMVWQVATQFADVILLFFLAWMISFILEPIVALLHVRRGVSRPFAVSAVYLAVLVAVLVGLVKLLPRLSSQLIQLSLELPTYVEWTNGRLLEAQATLAQQGVAIAPESLLTYQEVTRHVESLGPLLLANTVQLATGIANVLFQVFVILILSFYFTLDGHRISAALLRALPSTYRDDAQYFFVSVQRAFAGFIRGQLAQAALYGMGTAAVMQLVGLQLVLLSAVLAGAFMLLPFIGPFLALVMPLAVAAVTTPDRFLVVLVALFMLQQIVINVIAPRLMSETVGMHPLLVFLAVLGGAKVAGVWGAVFGVPIVGVVVAMISFYWATVEDRQARLQHATAGLTTEPESESALDDALAGAPSTSSEAAQSGGTPDLQPVAAPTPRPTSAGAESSSP